MTDEPAILLVEDDPDHADLFRRCLADIDGQAWTLIHCHGLVAAQQGLSNPHVKMVFLDYRLGADTGLEFLRQMRADNDHRPVVVLTGQGSEYVAVDMMRAGADDYVVKSDLDVTLLEQVIDRAIKKLDQVQQAQAEHAQIAQRFGLLTPREKEVLALIVEGKTNKQISQVLHRSENTIKIHRARIMHKTQAHTAADLTRMAMTIQSPPPLISRNRSN